jgi:hypothetical protein
MPAVGAQTRPNQADSGRNAFLARVAEGWSAIGSEGVAAVGLGHPAVPPRCRV